MHTSTFWRFFHRRDPRLVSIALKTPEWFQGRCYPALAPRLDMLPLEEEEYRREYQAILDQLGPLLGLRGPGAGGHLVMLGAAGGFLSPAPGGGLAGESPGHPGAGAAPELPP